MYKIVLFIVISYIVLVVIGSQTIHPFKYPLEAPDFFQVTTIDPPGLYVTWSTIVQGADNPVLGFKIKIWTIQLNTEAKYELVGGDQYPADINNVRPAKPFKTNITAATTPREVTVHGSHITSQKVTTDIKYNELYEVRVLAFNRDGPGPMTKPIRVQIIKANGYHAHLQRQESGCSVSVQSFAWGTDYAHRGDQYPLLYYYHI